MGFSSLIKFDVLAVIRVTTTSSSPATRILTPKEMEEACQQPPAVTTAVTMIVAAVANALSMFAMFTKMESMFNPQKILAEHRKNLLTKRSKSGLKMNKTKLYMIDAFPIKVLVNEQYGGKNHDESSLILK